MVKERDRQPVVGPGGAGFRQASQRGLIIALVIIGSFFVIELVAGLLTNSLALIADAGHLLTDVAAIMLALLAIWFASRPASAAHTYGYFRVEIFSALVNGIALWAVAGYIVYQAYGRIIDPPEVNSLPMVLVATGGFIAQLGTSLLLRRAARESLNVRGAYIHVLTDAVQSVGVVVAGLLMLRFGWFLADPIISVVIAVLITWSGGRIAWAAVRVLLESAPVHVDIQALSHRLGQVEGVRNVHDIHAWSITTGYEVMSAHVAADGDNVDRNRLLERLREIAYEEFRISHITIQLEDVSAACQEGHLP